MFEIQSITYKIQSILILSMLTNRPYPGKYGQKCRNYMNCSGEGNLKSRGARMH